ncbi:MAG: PAS domain S-box protein [Magnetococcales bacterium]|nr:PAS domain S-box protein [Magnetococcales bacterium]
MITKNIASKKPLIFVVDDDEIFQNILAVFLEKSGYDIKRLEDGKQAVEQSEELLPDLILMDAVMPGIDGFTACHLIKQNKKTAKIPIIMVTSNDDAKSVEKAFGVGAEEYITKPIQWLVLRQRIIIYLERKKNLLALQASEERFRSITDSTIDAIISVDENGKIIFWNKAAENIFGYSVAEIVGKPVTTIMPKNLRKKHTVGFKRFLISGKSRFKGNNIELEGLRNDGRRFPLEISISSWDNTDKRYISAVIRDITERRRVISTIEGVALFDTQIIEQIYSLWQRVCSRDDYQLTFQKLKTILELVFLAGIQSEEGESISLAVSLINPNYFLNKGIPNDKAVISFEKRLPFNLDSLGKLAPGFDPQTTVIAVSSNKENHEILEIWGAIFVSKRGNTSIDPYPFIPEHLDVITVSSLKPGSLTISWGGHVLANFNSGHFTQTSKGSDSSCIVSQTMQKMIKSHEEFKKEGTPYWLIYQEMMNLLVEEATKRCQGATIIWLPEKLIDKAKKSLITKYPLFQEANTPQNIANLCAMQKEKKRISNRKKNGLNPETADKQVLEDTINECKKRLIDHVDFMSQLTNVDGALIISHKLNPISFGSVLATRQWSGKTYYFQPGFPESREEVNLSKYGTRHTSAVNFVGKHPGVIAFVISHDGPISCLLSNKKEEVLWIPDFLSSRWNIY